MYPNNPEVADLKSGPTPDQDQQWSTGLYDCCEDPKNSCKIQGLVYYAMARIGCGWLYGGIYRSKMRRHLSLPEAPCSDWLLHCCCCVCALTQEYRELKNRGANPSLGGYIS
ncbi:hypothetical protein LWI28_007922 [Acer negundo]|uniref:Uncharacterized protein n=1 Tax=Acer negundo TaxID=4023 RepID=A0AAD5IM99_ACENE|nr:hypothetical protein LWI28_007922 [Acer negundo]